MSHCNFTKTHSYKMVGGCGRKDNCEIRRLHPLAMTDGGPGAPALVPARLLEKLRRR